MPSESREFFSTVVLPTVQEFLESQQSPPFDEDSLRLGKLAAIVLNQMADYWHCDFVRDGSKPADLRGCLASECPYFGVIWDLADATKHAKIDRSELISKHSQVKSPESVVVQASTPAGQLIESLQVYAILNDGARVNLVDAVRCVADMWNERLSRVCEA